MSSFNETPFTLRGRPIPSLCMTSQSDAQQTTPVSTNGGESSACQSVQRAPSSEPMLRPATPEPVNAAELERTPSPYIKREPEDEAPVNEVSIKKKPSDKNAYSAFTIPDEEYDPTTVFTSLEAHQNASNTAYDPERPGLRRSKRYDTFERVLSTVDGESVEAPTFCFNDSYRNRQLVHVLKCHGEVETEKPVACGPNCTVKIDAEKPVIGKWINCTHPVCAEKRNKRHASVFIPRKRARTATPALQNSRASVSLPLDGFGTPAYTPAQPARGAGISKADQEIIERNKKILADLALSALVHNPSNQRTLRPLSKRHPGYATKTELREERAMEKLFKDTEGLDIGIDLNAIVSAAIDASNGGQARSGHKTRLGKRKAPDSKDFEKHDKAVGADT